MTPIESTVLFADEDWELRYCEDLTVLYKEGDKITNFESLSAWAASTAVAAMGAMTDVERGQLLTRVLLVLDMLEVSARTLAERLVANEGS